MENAYLAHLLVCHRSVHSVCLWDEKGANKVHQALHEDIIDFIKQAQAVSISCFRPIRLLELLYKNVGRNICSLVCICVTSMLDLRS